MEKNSKLVKGKFYYLNDICLFNKRAKALYLGEKKFPSDRPEYTKYNGYGIEDYCIDEKGNELIEGKNYVGKGVFMGYNSADGVHSNEFHGLIDGYYFIRRIVGDEAYSFNNKGIKNVIQIINMSKKTELSLDGEEIKKIRLDETSSEYIHPLLERGLKIENTDIIDSATIVKYNYLNFLLKKAEFKEGLSKFLFGTC